MVELKLPKNSQTRPGKTWPRPDAVKVQEYQVYRYNPDNTDNPQIVVFYVDRAECGPMVLDGLLWIKNNIDDIGKPHYPH